LGKFGLVVDFHPIKMVRDFGVFHSPRFKPRAMMQTHTTEWFSTIFLHVDKRPNQSAWENSRLVVDFQTIKMVCDFGVNHSPDDFHVGTMKHVTAMKWFQPFFLSCKEPQPKTGECFVMLEKGKKE
jgi:hypothetical protein